MSACRDDRQEYLLRQQCISCRFKQGLFCNVRYTIHEMVSSYVQTSLSWCDRFQLLVFKKIYVAIAEPGMLVSGLTAQT